MGTGGSKLGVDFRLFSGMLVPHGRANRGSFCLCFVMEKYASGKPWTEEETSKRFKIYLL